MTKFDEKALELSIIELLEDEHYTHLQGDVLSRGPRDVLIESDFRHYLSQRYPEMTVNEVDSLIHRFKTYEGNLYEMNMTFIRDLMGGIQISREDATKKDLHIYLLDYDTPENNTFRVVNQMEIEGVGGQVRIPDAIIYVNGLPLVVIEFKSAIKENTTIYDAYKQLTIRYRRDIPDLFIYNAFVVICDGVNSRYGSLFTPYDYFYSWRKVNSKDEAVEGINALYTMIRGLFAKDRLLAVCKDFLYFPDSASSKELKVVCRYPQYFAATRLKENILEHMQPNGDGKGGTYFGATGCGKSFTMLFLTRLLMKDPAFRSPTILVITDRTDLDDQLSKQFLAAKKYIGDEHVVNIESREKLGTELRGRTSGGVFLTTIQKFTENLNLLSDRSNIICISDEAHRSQTNLKQKVKTSEEGLKRSYGFAKFLHDSLPNATYVGFTGTPVDPTLEVFGDIVESYTMTESVRDGITVNLVYDGRAARVTLDQDKVKEIEDYYAKCAELGATQEQIEASQKAVAHIDAIIGDPDRLRAVAEDFIAHYESRVSEGASVEGKAMFVCSERSIAYNLYKIITELRPEWTEKHLCPEGIEITEEEAKKLMPIERVKLVMTRDKDDEPALYEMLGTRETRKEFDRQFKDVKSNFKIAIVVDMWLTGFDVPALDTIYIDKPLQMHTLIQTISRVNRVYPGKEKGLIVDYIGIKKNMDIALHKYTNFQGESFEGIEQSVIIVKDQLEILERLFCKFDATDYYHGTPKAQLACLNRAVEYVQTTEELERRFMAAVKRMRQAYNLCCSSDAFTDAERDLINFYCAVRSILFKLVHGEAPDVGQMTRKVREMLEGAIQSDGIEELFETGKHIQVDIFSEEYIARIEQIQLPNTKVKVLQRLLTQAIDEMRKVNKVKSIEFAERMQQIVDAYNNRRRDVSLANEVLDDIAGQLAELLHQIKEEKDSHKDLGISFEEKVFFDILQAVSKKREFEYPEDKMVELAKRLKSIVDDKSAYPDWYTRDDIKAELNVDIILLMDEFGFPPVIIDAVYKEVLEQAENYKKNRPKLSGFMYSDVEETIIKAADEKMEE